MISILFSHTQSTVHYTTCRVLRVYPCAQVCPHNILVILCLPRQSCVAWIHSKILVCSIVQVDRDNENRIEWDWMRDMAWSGFSSVVLDFNEEMFLECPHPPLALVSRLGHWVTWLEASNTRMFCATSSTLARASLNFWYRVRYSPDSTRGLLFLSHVTLHDWYVWFIQLMTQSHF